MKLLRKWYIWLAAAGLALTFWGCEQLFSYEYKIVGVWQVSHTYLNGESIDSTNNIGYAPGTYYYMYADHVLAVRALYNGEIRESTFATYIVDQKAKTVEFNYSIYGRRYHFTADIKRLTQRDFFIEFTDDHGDHWRLELFSRTN